MTTLLLVLPDKKGDSTCPAPLRGALADARIVLVGQATCNTMVQSVAEHAPQQVLLCVPQLDADLCDALRAWNGEAPCALSLLSPPLGADALEKLVALGVHGWAPIEAVDASSLHALLAQARARWQREAALRAELAELRTRFDERRWIDRAKGLLMSARGIGEDEAFGLLRGAAMHANLRLGEVSRSVLETARWAEAINRAGQLRMLSQRLVRLAAQALAGVDARRGRVLREQSVLRVQSNLVHLGTLDLGEVAAQALAEVHGAWTELAVALRPRLTPETLSETDRCAETLLAAAEMLTEALEASGARRALRIVNICGRQRMRVQRLAKDALLASILTLPASKDRLVPTMSEFEAALIELEHAPLSSGEIRAALVLARDEWLRLVGGVRSADGADGRLALARSSEALLDVFDRLTASYEHSLQVIMS